MDLKNNLELLILYGVIALATYGAVRLTMDLIEWL